MILAADIGGTKADLALFAIEGETLVETRHERFPTAAWDGLEPLLDRFLGAERVTLTACAVGVAGPVRDGRVAGTNLPWSVEARSLAARLGLPRVHLLNDLEAVAHGLAGLDPARARPIHPGTADPRGPVALLAPGTGLGQAFLVHDEDGATVTLASEGGHADFAPRSELEWELARWIAARHEGHASWERVLSGIGLVHIYEFLRDTGRCEEPAWLAAARAAGDANAALAAADGKAAIATRTLDLFVGCLGAQAGNLALTLLATGGVYLAGGIPPRLADRLADGRFVAAFRDKGRLAPLVATIPVHIVLDEHIAVRGAATVALRGLAAAPARPVPAPRS
jgi:glucokinase